MSHLSHGKQASKQPNEQTKKVWGWSFKAAVERTLVQEPCAFKFSYAKNPGYLALAMPVLTVSVFPVLETSFRISLICDLCQRQVLCSTLKSFCSFWLNFIREITLKNTYKTWWKNNLYHTPVLLQAHLAQLKFSKKKFGLVNLCSFRICSPWGKGRAYFISFWTNRGPS